EPWWYDPKMVIAFVSPPLVAPATIFSATVLLPARPIPKRLLFPYQSSGVLLIGLPPPLGVVLAYLSFTHFGFDTAVRALQLTITVTAGLMVWGSRSRMIARRARQPTADVALQNDPRRPVVYLRPFANDEENFTILAETDWTIHDHIEELAVAEDEA